MNLNEEQERQIRELNHMSLEHHRVHHNGHLFFLFEEVSIYHRICHRLLLVFLHLIRCLFRRQRHQHQRIQYQFQYQNNNKNKNLLRQHLQKMTARDTTGTGSYEHFS